jgi:thymidine phosphorylase
LGALTLEVCAPTDGVVIGIDNLQIARIARMAGAPKVQSAGVDLLHKLGDNVAQGEPLYRVHAAFQSDLEFASQLCQKSTGYTLGLAQEVPHVFVEF